MLPAFQDDRPSPVVVALGAISAVILVAALVLVVQRAGESEGPALVVAPGKLVFASDQGVDYDIWTVNTDGSARTRLTDSRSVDSFPAWSPDGTKVVFSSDRDGIVQVPEIYVMNADGTGQTRLTDNRSVDELPSFSPDGTKILFRSLRGENADIWTMDADGKNPIRLTEDPADDQFPAWSPDGSKVAFQSNRGTSGDRFSVWVMNADGSDERQVTKLKSGAAAPSWSPDGNQLVFQTNRGGGTHLFVIALDGTGLAQITRGSGFNDYVADWQRPVSAVQVTTTTAPTTTVAPTPTTRRRR